ncbi:MAG: class I SAM-dependent methyltransferase [Deltaproteobacteria bacterium]|nr:class I SAM-dependent methyltransferase [Deltaproteobacteria bacterium]
MQYKIHLWIQEIRRYNSSLHLVSNKILPQIESRIRDCMSLISYIHEPIIADIGSGSGLPGIPYKK